QLPAGLLGRPGAAGVLAEGRRARQQANQRTREPALNGSHRLLLFALNRCVMNATSVLSGQPPDLVAGQRLEEFHQVALLVLTQVYGLQLPVAEGVLVAAL